MPKGKIPDVLKPTSWLSVRSPPRLSLLMSFYLDDYPDDEQNSSSETCPLCSGTLFYNDPVTGTRTCQTCYTQSQTATQEELDYDEGIGLAAHVGKRTYTARGGGTGRQRGGRVGRPLTEYDRSRKLPDSTRCCLAFQWLLWDASKCVSKLAGIQEDNASESDHPDHNGNRNPSIMEQTVKRIWFAYLHTWMEATREYSKQYPEMRVSFRDYFLEDMQKTHLMRHLSVTIGKRVEDGMLEEIREEMQQKHRENRHNKDENDEEKSCSSFEHLSTSFDCAEDENIAHPSSNHRPAAKRDKRLRRPFLTIAQLRRHVLPSNPKRHLNGIYEMHPHQAVLKIQPSLTLLLSILQLALTHLRTGVAPYHLTRWVANGQLPHGLNGYARLPTRHKKRIEMAKNFFVRSFVPPAGVVANLTDMLATACSWYDDEMADIKPSITDVSNICNSVPEIHPPLQNSDICHSSKTAYLFSEKGSAAHDAASSKSNVTAVDHGYHTKSLFNVPLLASRMVRDFGFDQRVLDNTLALMGVESSCSWGKEACKTEDDSDHQIECRDASVSQTSEHCVKLDSTLASLKCMTPDKLYTPLHVAAVIMLACKQCPGWETWKIANLHAAPNTNDSGSAMQSLSAFVPWNESQFHLLGNGPTVDYYLDFLHETAFNGLEPSTRVTRFFQSLKRDTNEDLFAGNNRECTVRAMTVNKKIAPCVILAGAPNPNDHNALLSTSISLTSAHAQHSTTNNIERHSNDCKYPQHSHYFHLLEYICFIIEECNTRKFHGMIEELELSYRDQVQCCRSQKKRKYSVIQ